MRYLIRAVKYFFYFALMLVVIMAGLYFLNMTDPQAKDFASMFFKDGVDSIKLIALVFAGVSAVYPLIGFAKIKAIVPGEYADIRGMIVSYMEEKGYVLEREDGENLSFRARSVVRKITRMFEDRIELERDFTGFVVKGKRSDIVRIIHGLEARARQL
ncbi:MAG: hypothetical protein IJ151_07135 [Bacteroidales bacterium]|nr:hypothetical protein [Bacteroidales bacterium]